MPNPYAVPGVTVDALRAPCRAFVAFVGAMPFTPEERRAMLGDSGIVDLASGGDGELSPP